MMLQSVLEDERTVRGAWSDPVRPPAGAASGPQAPADHPLPYGTLLEGLRVTGLVGEGGFGVVYRAWDDALDRAVAIKEFMPALLAVRRRQGAEVSVRAERYRDAFDAGLRSFLNEARMLARFDHPALVKVLRFWEANHTAYMAMPYYEGPTLQAALSILGGPPPEETLRDWLRPLLDALALLHRERCYHRDIAPDNILLTPSGPLLLDFGAARHVVSGMTQALTVVLKRGYAPVEQYGQAMPQGAWTDLYALAGVLHFAITGQPPPPAVERVVQDTRQPLARAHAGRYGAGFLRAIDAALAVRPQDRPQDVAAWRALLDAGLPEGSPLRLDQPTPPPAGFWTAGFSSSELERPPWPATASGDAADDPAARSGPDPLDALEPTPAAAFPSVRARPWHRWGRLSYGLVTGAMLLMGAAVWWMHWRGGSVPETPPAIPVPASGQAATPASPAEPVPVVPAPVLQAPAAAPPTSSAPVRVEPPAPDAPAAADTLPAPAPGPASGAPAAPAEPLSPAAAPGRPRPAPLARAVREAVQQAQPRPAESAAAAAERSRPPRCSDILRKASLEPLGAEEADYLRKECR